MTRWGVLGVILPALSVVSQPGTAQSPSSRRFVIDSDLHYRNEPDFIDKVVRTYRPGNAMACVLTPVRHFDAVKKAAAEYPDVVIPYGDVSMDEPAVLAQIDPAAPPAAPRASRCPPRLGAQQVQARIKLDPDRVIGEVPRTSLATSPEHLGRCIYGGIFEERSPLSDADGFRRDVLDAARGLGLNQPLRYR